jgi:hypothetical protein
MAVASSLSNGLQLLPDALLPARLSAHTLSPYLTTPTANMMTAAGRRSERLVEDLGCSGHLHGERLQVAKPQLVVLDGVGSDVVLPAEVQQQERRPERHQLVFGRPASNRQMAEDVYRCRVGQHVRRPEEGP